jgi:hypothetical protein
MMFITLVGLAMLTMLTMLTMQHLVLLHKLGLESPVQPSTASILQTVLASLILSYTLAASYISSL